MLILTQVAKAAANRCLPEVALDTLRRRHYAAQIRESRLSDEPDLAMLPRLIRPGDVCFDLGANLGRYTKHMALLTGEAGIVLAVEPVPMTFRYLCSNISQLELPGTVYFLNAGVSNLLRRERFSVPQWKDGSPNIYEAQIGGAEGQLVNITTVNTLAQRFGRVDFIKCDVENHEWQVLQGAMDVFANEKMRPAWLIETHNPDVFDWFGQHRYRCLIEKDGDLEQHRGERKTNFFFLPEERQVGAPKV